MRKTPALFFLLTVACAPFPELEGRISADAARAGFPALVPLDPLLASADAQSKQPSPVGLGGRIAALQARANALRTPVIDTAARARLAAGIAARPLR